VSLGGASAHTQNVPTSLVFEPVATGPTTVDYKGQVFGSRLCRANRAVDILVGGVLVATVFTDSGGNFHFNAPKPPAGTMATAIAKRKVQKRRGHKHACAQKLETKKAPQ
jgi:hypothetical protein